MNPSVTIVNSTIGENIKSASKEIVDENENVRSGEDEKEDVFSGLEELTIVKSSSLDRDDKHIFSDETTNEDLDILLSLTDQKQTVESTEFPELPVASARRLLLDTETGENIAPQQITVDKGTEASKDSESLKESGSVKQVIWRLKNSYSLHELNNTISQDAKKDEKTSKKRETEDSEDQFNGYSQVSL